MVHNSFLHPYFHHPSKAEKPRNLAERMEMRPKDEVWGAAQIEKQNSRAWTDGAEWLENAVAASQEHFVERKSEENCFSRQSRTTMDYLGPQEEGDLDWLE
jgi:hypothetical protein